MSEGYTPREMFEVAQESRNQAAESLRNSDLSRDEARASHETFSQSSEAMRSLKDSAYKEGVVYNNSINSLADSLGGEEDAMAVAKDTLLGSNRGKAEVVEAKESTIEGVDLSRVQSFEELAAAITENGGLDSSVGFLTAEYLIGAINEVRQGKIEPTRLTRQGGLRAKVAELMDVK